MRTMRAGLAVAALVLVFEAVAVRADMTPGRSQNMFRGTIKEGAPNIKTLRDHYRNGDWKRLQSSAGSVLMIMGGVTTGAETHAFDIGTNYYIVTLIGEDFAGKNELIRFIVHNPQVDPFEMTLPGLKPDSPQKCFEVLLTEHPGAEFASRYEFERKDDPIYAQVPKAVDTLSLGLAGAITRLGFVEDPSGTTKVPLVVGCGSIPYNVKDLHAVVVEMDIPFKRANITVRNKIVIKNRNAARKKFVKAAAHLGTRFAPRSECATALITSAINCFLNNDEKLSPADSYETVFADFVDTNRDSCDGDFKQVLAADTALRAAVPDWSTITGSYTVSNLPPTKWTLGLATAGMLVISNNGRAKISDGEITYDPLTGAELMVTVNWHPWGADFARKSFLAKERFRFFWGGVFAPEVGVSAGLGWGLVSGLSVNAGWSALLIDKPKDDEIVSQPPTSSDPFRQAFATTWILGFGFNFK